MAITYGCSALALGTSTAQICPLRAFSRARSTAIITRVAKVSDAISTRPLTATRSPVNGLGAAPKALPSDPVANTASTTRTQNGPRAKRRTERTTCGWEEFNMSCYIPRCCLAGVTAISAVRAIKTSNSPSAKIMAMGRLRQ